MDTKPLGTDLPDGVRFIGPEPEWTPNWATGDAPTQADLNACVACGLCLPHCPTYRLTGEESASPRGRITAMRAVHEGRAAPDETFTRFMDLCLVCRACEDVCPSHVPFGRMMEASRTQIEPLRSGRTRFLRWLGLDVVLPSRTLTWLAGALAPLARPFLPTRVRALIPRGGGEPFTRLPRVTEAARRAAWDGRAALGLRAGSLVPKGEPRHDQGARAERLACGGAARADVLRSIGRAQRPPRHGAGAREEERARRSPTPITSW